MGAVAGAVLTEARGGTDWAPPRSGSPPPEQQATTTA